MIRVAGPWRATGHETQQKLTLAPSSLPTSAQEHLLCARTIVAAVLPVSLNLQHCPLNIELG